jgi:predicted TIM-barrel fold metal-dependent hydrolase
MIIDSHTHLSAGDERRYPVPHVEFPPGSGVVYGPTTPATAELFRSELGAAGVDRGVTISPYFYLWDNSYTIDAVREHGEWLAGVVLTDPRDPRSGDALKRLAAEGASGLRIHGYKWHRMPYDDPISEPLWRAAADLDLTFDACIDLDEYPNLERRIQQFPSLRIILDHCGYVTPPYPETLSLDPVLALARYPNVFAKVTFLPAATREPWPYRSGHGLVRRVIDAFGPERCMWAGGFPTQYHPDVSYVQSVDLFRTEIELSAQEREWILGKTAAGLWKWRDV